MAMREVPVEMSMAQTTPLVQPAASTVVAFNVVRPFRKLASGIVAASYIVDSSSSKGKETENSLLEPGCTVPVARLPFATTIWKTSGDVSVIPVNHVPEEKWITR